MSSDNGFVKLRRGILEHVRDRRLSVLEFAAYVIIIASAEHSTGTWFGSAGALARDLGIGVTTARETLRGLSRKGYISRPADYSRSRLPYEIKVCKYFNGDRQQVLELGRHALGMGRQALPMQPPGAIGPSATRLQREEVREEKNKTARKARSLSTETSIGKGPEATMLNRERYLEFCDLREKKKLPEGIKTWTEYQNWLDQHQPGWRCVNSDTNKASA